MDSKFSAYQKNVIKRFYENRENIALQRAMELVTELYLAEGKKRLRLWDNLSKNLALLGVQESVIAHLLEQDKPELVAEILSSLQ